MKKVLSYKNQSIDLQSKLKDWFLYDRNFGHERVKGMNYPTKITWTSYMQTNYNLLNSKLWDNLIVLQSYTYADLKNPYILC